MEPHYENQKKNEWEGAKKQYNGGTQKNQERKGLRERPTVAQCARRVKPPQETIHHCATIGSFHTGTGPGLNPGQFFARPSGRKILTEPPVFSFLAPPLAGREVEDLH